MKRFHPDWFRFESACNLDEMFCQRRLAQLYESGARNTGESSYLAYNSVQRNLGPEQTI